MHSVSLARPSCIGVFSEALRSFMRIRFDHIQPNFVGLQLLWLYRFLPSSFSLHLLDTVFLRTTLRVAKTLPLFLYCFQCLSTHTWGKLLCENDPAHS